MKIQIPKSLHESVETQNLVQFFKSELRVVFINTESKYRDRQHQETDLHPGLSYPEAQPATWSYDARIEIILQEALNKPIVEACRTLMRNNPLFSRGCSFNVNLILDAGLVAGGRGRDGGTDKRCSSHRQILFGARRRRKSTTMYRGRETRTTRESGRFLRTPSVGLKFRHGLTPLSGSLIRTPSAGSTWDPLDQDTKKKDCSFGRRGPTPLLVTIPCRPTALKRLYALIGQNFISKSFHGISSNNSSSMAHYQAQGNLL